MTTRFPRTPDAVVGGSDVQAGSGPDTVRRDGVLASWEPSGRGVVPAIVGLVVVANLVGVITVVLLLLGVEDGSGNSGRTPVLLAVAAYLAVAFPVGTVAGLRRQRTTNRWLMARRGPTSEEAGYALRLPVDTALIAGLIWLVGAVLVGIVAAFAFPDPRIGLRTAVATLLGRACSSPGASPAASRCSAWSCSTWTPAIPAGRASCPSSSSWSSRCSSASWPPCSPPARWASRCGTCGRR